MPTETAQRDYPLTKTVENGAFDAVAAEDVGQTLWDVLDDINRAVGLAGGEPAGDEMFLHLARTRGYLAEALIAWNLYIKAVKAQ